LNEITELVIHAIGELQSVNGGGAAELVGLGIAQALILPYAGLWGSALVTYNYFKD
jgi:hypothetical protein